MQHRSLAVQRLDPLAILADQRLRGVGAGGHAPLEVGERELDELHPGRDSLAAAWAFAVASSFAAAAAFDFFGGGAGAGFGSSW